MAGRRKETKNKAEGKAPDSRAFASESAHAAQTPGMNTDSSRKISREDFSTSISIQEKVALLAYSYWEERGKQGGSPEEDWYRAEREVLGRMSLPEK